jgi:hypothetical protein
MHGFSVTKRSTTIYAQRMAVGQIGIITSGDRFNGQPLMRTADRYVLLTDPQIQATDGNFYGIQVELLANGATLTLTVGSDALDETVLDFLQMGQKINAIKAHREATGLGLKESKDYVDALAKRMQAEGRLSDPLPEYIVGPGNWYHPSNSKEDVPF